MLWSAPSAALAVPQVGRVAAIRAHFSGYAVERGDALRSDHSHGGVAFLVETIPASDMTRIQLA